MKEKIKVLLSLSFVLNPAVFYLFLYVNQEHIRGAGAFFIVLFLSTLFFCIFFAWIFDEVNERFRRISSRKWYDYARAESWSDVVRIITTDPLSECRRDYFSYREIRGCYPNIVFFEKDCGVCWFHYVAMAVVMVFLLVAIDGIVYSIVRGGEVTRKDSMLGLFVTASTGVVIFIYNIKLKSRAENRIVWIKELRDEISRFFGVLGLDSEGNNVYEKSIAQKDLEIIMSRQYTYSRNKRRFGAKITDIVGSRFQLMSKLELMLNPSEKVHRALLALMRLCTKVYTINLDRVVLNELGLLVCEEDGHLLVYFYNKDIMSWREISDDDLISMVFRLSQYIMKTEWEQVKFIR